MFKRDQKNGFHESFQMQQGFFVSSHQVHWHKYDHFSIIYYFSVMFLWQSLNYDWLNADASTVSCYLPFLHKNL